MRAYNTQEEIKMEKIKFDKIREAIEKKAEDGALMKRVAERNRNRAIELLTKIEKFNESPDEIVINFENRWDENGLEWKANATYHCPGADFPTDIETQWFGDAGGADKETSAICRVLNDMMPIRYRLCYAEEMLLRGEWFGGRETFFAGSYLTENGIGDQPLPGFVITGGVKGIKRAMRALGYEAIGIIPLVFKKIRANEKNTMAGM